MEMQMVYALPRLFAAVGDHAEIGDALFLCNLRDDLKYVGHHCGIFRVISPQDPIWALGITRKCIGA